MTAPVRVQAQAVELPATEFGMLGQELPCGIPRDASRQSEDEVGVLGHYRHYCGRVILSIGSTDQQDPPAPADRNGSSGVIRRNETGILWR